MVYCEYITQVEFTLVFCNTSDVAKILCFLEMLTSSKILSRNIVQMVGLCLVNLQIYLGTNCQHLHRIHIRDRCLKGQEADYCRRDYI